MNRLPGHLVSLNRLMVFSNSALPFCMRFVSFMPCSFLPPCQEVQGQNMSSSPVGPSPRGSPWPRPWGERFSRGGFRSCGSRRRILVPASCLHLRAPPCTWQSCPSFRCLQSGHEGSTSLLLAATRPAARPPPPEPRTASVTRQPILARRRRLSPTEVRGLRSK